MYLFVVFFNNWLAFKYQVAPTISAVANGEDGIVDVLRDQVGKPSKSTWATWFLCVQLYAVLKLFWA